MTRVLRFDAGTLQKSRKTSQGYLRVDGWASRVGIQEYRNPDGSIRRELREDSAVFDQDSLTGFEGAPITDDHPSAMVDIHNAKHLTKGTVLSVGRRDGEHVAVSLVITDPDLIRKMEGGKRQLSTGYYVELDETPGTHPKFGRYDAKQVRVGPVNHLAVVERGRAGTASVRMDSALVDVHLDDADEIPADVVTRLDAIAKRMDEWDEASHPRAENGQFGSGGGGGGGSKKESSGGRSTIKVMPGGSEHRSPPTGGKHNYPDDKATERDYEQGRDLTPSERARYKDPVESERIRKEAVARNSAKIIASGGGAYSGGGRDLSEDPTPSERARYNDPVESERIRKEAVERNSAEIIASARQNAAAAEKAKSRAGTDYEQGRDLTPSERARLKDPAESDRIRKEMVANNLASLKAKVAEGDALKAKHADPTKNPFAHTSGSKSFKETPEEAAYIAKATETAHTLVKDWQSQLKDKGVEVKLGGSLTSGLAMPGPVQDADVRFLFDGDRKELVPEIERVTGLKLRKTIQVGGGPDPISDAYMIEGVIEKDGVKLEVEGALRTAKGYTGWQNQYKEVLTPDEIKTARARKWELSQTAKGDGRKAKEYKEYKNSVLAEVQKRIATRASSDKHGLDDRAAKQDSIPADVIARLDAIAKRMDEFNDDQPRDENGRFSSTGGGGGGSKSGGDRSADKDREDAAQDLHNANHMPDSVSMNLEAALARISELEARLDAFPPAPAGDADGDEAAAPAPKKCPSCGTMNAADATECAKCGATLAAPKMDAADVARLEGERDVARQAAEDAKAAVAAATEAHYNEIAKVRKDADESVSKKVRESLDVLSKAVMVLGKGAKIKLDGKDTDLVDAPLRAVKVAVVKHLKNKTLTAEKLDAYVDALFDDAVETFSPGAKSLAAVKAVVEDNGRQDTAVDPAPALDPEAKAAADLKSRYATAWMATDK